MSRSRFLLCLPSLFIVHPAAWAWSPGSLLDGRSAVGLVTGKAYDFSGYIEAVREPRVFSDAGSLGTSHHCVSLIFGEGIDRPYYRARSGRRIRFRAVVAEYRDSVVVGANRALGDVRLTAFENQCGRREVLVMVPSPAGR